MKLRMMLASLGMVLATTVAAQAQTPNLPPPTPSPAVQGLDGRWEGAIETPQGPLTAVFRIKTEGDKTTTLMDSPMQDVEGIPAIAKRDGNGVVIEVPLVNGDFTGEVSADGAKMSGVWHQNGMELATAVERK